MSESKYSMKDSGIKVSVCIPVYNGESYLRKCLDSLAAQTLKEMEICIVDDGSTDGSLEIIREYADRYSFIRYLHQENRGTSIARQRTVDMAQGEYIGFVDADDWVEKGMFEDLYLASENGSYDMVECRALQKGKVVNLIPEGSYQGDEVFQQFIRAKIRTFLWIRIYHHRLFKKCVFPNRYLCVFEDIYALICLFSEARSYYVLPMDRVYYHHETIKTSITHVARSPEEQYKIALLRLGIPAHFRDYLGEESRRMENVDFWAYIGLSVYLILCKHKKYGVGYDQCLRDCAGALGTDVKTVKKYLRVNRRRLYSFRHKVISYLLGFRLETELFGS